MRLLDFLPRADGHAEVANQAVVQPVNPAMHRKFLSALPRVAHDARLANVEHLLDHVQFAEAIHALDFVVECLEQRLVLVAHVLDVRDKHESLLKALDNEVERVDRLCELNVIEQVLNVCQTSIVRDAWQRGQELTVHSWIYGLHDGIIRDLGMAVGSWKEVEKAHRKAVSSLGKPQISKRPPTFPKIFRQRTTNN